MQITKARMQQIIQEEYSKLLNEIKTKVGDVTVAVDPKKRSATVSKGDTSVSGRVGKKGAGAGIEHKGKAGDMQYNIGGDIGTGGANLKTRTQLGGGAELGLHGGSGGLGGEVSGIPLARAGRGPTARGGWGSKRGGYGAIEGENWGVGYQQKGQGAGLKGTFSKKIGPGRLGVQAGYDPKTGGGSAGATYGFRFQENIVRNPHFNQTIQEELQAVLAGGSAPITGPQSSTLVRGSSGMPANSSETCNGRPCEEVHGSNWHNNPGIVSDQEWETSI